MNCKETRDAIDSYFISGGGQLSNEVLTHADSCESCSNYYQSQLEVESILTEIKSTEAFLSDPIALTDNIMAEVAKLEMPLSSDVKTATRSSVILKWSQRLLAAASLALLLTFSFEQYVVVHKIINLEEQLSQISTEAPMLMTSKAQFIAVPNFISDKLSKKPFYNFLMQQAAKPAGHDSAKQNKQKQKASDQ